MEGRRALEIPPSPLQHTCLFNTEKMEAQREKVTPQGHPTRTTTELKPESRAGGTEMVSFGVGQGTGGVGNSGGKGGDVHVCRRSTPEWHPDYCWPCFCPHWPQSPFIPRPVSRASARSLTSLIPHQTGGICLSWPSSSANRGIFPVLFIPP